MKQFLFFIILLCSSSLCRAESINLIVDNKVAGTLSQRIPYDDKLTVENLIVSGEINADDMAYIDELNSKYSLTGTLDLSNAMVVSGGRYLAGNSYLSTTNNTLNVRIFTTTKKLKKFVVPRSITEWNDGTYHQANGSAGTATLHSYLNIDSLIIDCPNLKTINNGIGSPTYLYVGEGIQSLNIASKYLDRLPGASDDYYISAADSMYIHLPKTLSSLYGHKRMGSPEVTIFSKILRPDNLLTGSNNWAQDVLTHGVIYVPNDTKKYYESSIFKKLNIVAPISVKTILLEDSVINMNVGETHHIGATISPKDATIKDINWTSSDSSIVSVDTYGNITSHTIGNAIITAACGEVSAICKVTVNPITATVITLNVEGMTLLVGQSDKLKASILPENTTNKTITWESDNEAVATVGADGTVAAVSVGEANITATCGKATATCKVTVNPITATAISLNVEEMTLLVGQSDKLKASVLPENTTDKTVTWESDNEAVATVGADGTVAAVSVGEANITATCGKATATCKVTVNPITATGIILNVEELTLLVGQSDKLKASVLPENTTNKAITWESANEDIATVATDGTVTGVSFGVAIITAKCGDISASCRVTVITKALAPTQLLRKGDGSSNTFIAMMDQDDKMLESMGYRYVFGYDSQSDGTSLIEDSPWRYAHTDSDVYWNGGNDFWVFAYYVEADGTVYVSSRRHLDGRLDNDFNPIDFIGKTSTNAEQTLAIFTIEGHYVGKDLNKLAPGIYIVKTSASSYKIIK
ncbi:MAG: Ig domain-containing protein [Barnesiella sp.]|nr:Ig domain-containing protein [Barnesiella sp.]